LQLNHFAYGILEDRAKKLVSNYIFKSLFISFRWKRCILLYTFIVIYISVPLYYCCVSLWQIVIQMIFICECLVLECVTIQIKPFLFYRILVDFLVPLLTCLTCSSQLQKPCHYRYEAQYSTSATYIRMRNSSEIKHNLYLSVAVRWICPDNKYLQCFENKFCLAYLYVKI
jgi:hypothetical protein